MADTVINDLDAAVRDAVDKNPPPPDALLEELTGKKDESKAEKSEVKEPEKAEEKTEEVAAEYDEEEVKSALVFFRALNDPAQATQLAQAIAKNAGFELTKKEEKVLIRDAKAILREKLGDNYDILSGDALSAAVQEIVDATVETKVAERTKPVLDQMSLAKKQENERLANAAMEDFYKRHDIPKAERDAVEAKMMKKFEVMPAAAGATVESYLDDIYYLTHREAAATKTVKKTVQKINENAKERNSSGEGTGNEDRIKRGSSMPSLDESVRAAFKGLRLDD